MAQDDEFDRIVAENPDVTMGGPGAVLVKYSDEVALGPFVNFDEVAEEVGKALLDPTVDWVGVWSRLVDVPRYPAELRWAFANEAYMFAIKYLFYLSPGAAALVLPRVQAFLGLAAAIRLDAEAAQGE